MYSLRKRVIPCLLLSDGGFVKTKKFKRPMYIGDPINSIKLFNDMCPDEVVVLDISRNGAQPDFDLLAELAGEAFMPMAYGGGIKTVKDAEQLVRMGFEKVVVNTLLWSNPAVVKDIVSILGSSSVIASLDFSRIPMLGHRLRKQSRIDYFEDSIPRILQHVEDLGVGELLIQSINRDGMMNGFDEDLASVASEYSNVPLVFAGGADSLESIGNLLSRYPVSGVGVGGLFVYHGGHRGVLINYPAEDELEKITRWES